MAGKKSGTGWLNVVVDYGPLLVFLGVYKFHAPEGSGDLSGEIAAIIYGTAAFMLAAVIALGVSWWLFGRVSPMLWLSTALIVVFGGLTVFLGDPVFVQVKPTIIYALFGVALLAAWARSTPLLQILLATAFEGVDRAGWLLLSRNWGVFFLALAGVNEVLRATLSFEGWLWAKFWVFLPLTFAFTFTQIPMLLRHGLNVEARDRPLKEQPPTGE